MSDLVDNILDEVQRETLLVQIKERPPPKKKVEEVAT